MTPELWQRLKPLFHAALDCDPSERAKFIGEACAGDAELQLHLNALLRAEEQGTMPPGPLLDLPKLLDAAMVRFRLGQVVLDRFRIVRQIGTGGMGEVYEAEDLQLGTIALKTIRPGIASSKDAFERFRQEVQLARRVSGPQVCRIHELFLLPASAGQAPTAFLTMEYLDGITLASKLRKEGPLALKDALRVALDICEGLRLIHDNGIIHRDLKSGNIMVCRQNGSTRTVLMDFGLAHGFSTPLSADDTTLPPAAFHTMEGAILGTPEYMAPEQFEARPASPATDIYALGIILYELVTGVHPYSARTPMGAAIRRAQHPKPASSVQRAVPRHWDRVIERCLEFEPEKRFQSAAEVAKALRAGPGNLNNLRKDQPWLIPVACVLAAGMLARVGWLGWQAREQYHPSADARRWYDAGLSALREGNCTRATRSLDAALAQDPHYVMAHVRMAEAWNDLDFQGNAQHEMVIAAAGEHYLSPVDHMYFDAIQDTVAGDTAGAVELYRRILDRLPDPEKAAGLVDLGMANERAGDLQHALENYASAASRDPDGAASYMHTGILESRRDHVPEANRAFAQAEKIFAAELNQEGLANLEYERGYAANVSGDASGAQKHLQRSLEEAIGIGSVQLQIKVLTQLSSATARFDAKRAAEYAQQAIDLARQNRLDAWAATGLVRLAAVQLREHKFDEAEASVRQGLQLAQASQQPRAEALANVTLASLMNQEHRPGEVVAPAQAALDYYRKNGFFAPAGSASILLIRAERDKGHYSQALTSANAFLDLASRSGVPDLTRQAEELIGTVLNRMQRYPEALTHFLSAKHLADAASSQQSEAIFAADMLWKLGRYAECDQTLRFEPANDAMAALADLERNASLLSRLKYADAFALSRQMQRNYPGMDSLTREELSIDRGIAESHLQKAKEALKEVDTLSANESFNNPADEAERELVLAEISLQAGLAQRAEGEASKAAGQFRAVGALDSELRSAGMGASAAKIAGDSEALSGYSQEIVDTVSKIQQTWTPQASQTYLSRPDIQVLLRENRATQFPNRR
jgi:predicted TPR repeat methyltransferase